MRTDDFNYELPPELIAQVPRERGASRLLVLDRQSGAIGMQQFADLPGFLKPGDLVVLNDTRVTARRILTTRSNGHPLEILLLAPRGDLEWEALARPARPLHPGVEIELPTANGATCCAQIVDVTDEGGRVLRFASQQERDSMAHAGTVPLPPYIHTPLKNEERYQTVYAGPGGSAAAPTAGLHFTEAMLDTLRAEGIETATVTLHVGVDTFRPVKTETVEEHQMHGEWYTIPPATAHAVANATGRVVAIGTTVVRALESAARSPRNLRVGANVTRLFITPGFQYQVVDGLLTNFHLPKSTLLMLVSALAGREHVLAAYRRAVDERMLFYSFGDAMLII